MRTYSRKKPLPQEISGDLCRLCLGRTAQMTPIFGAETRDIFATIAMRIMTCLGLEVSIDDEFPKHICQHCNNQLYRFYNFKKNCAATFRKLKASVGLKNVKSDINAKSEATQIKIQPKETTEDLITPHTSETKDPQIPLTQIGATDQLNACMDETKPVTQKNLQFQVTFEQSADVTQTVQLQEKSEEFAVTNQIYESQVKEDENVIVDSPLNVDNCVVVDEECDTQNTIDSADVFSSYVVSALVEQGVLARRGDSLEVLSQETKTFKLMTAYGSPVIMELVEEEPEGCKVPKLLDSQGSNTRCPHCGVRFSSRGALVRHLRVHSGERPYVCRTCGRAFSQREVLRRHELLHTDERPFPCAACPKAYTQRGALEAHARRHAPAAPAARRCPRCPKAFLHASGLSRHMKVHEGRNYFCNDCPRTFCDKSSLVRHARAHMRRNKPNS